MYSVLSKFYDVDFKKHCKTQTVLSPNANAQKMKLLNKVAQLRPPMCVGLRGKSSAPPVPKSRKIFERKIRSALAHSLSYQSPLSLWQEVRKRERMCLPPLLADFFSQ